MAYTIKDIDLSKYGPDEPVFILRAQDITAPTCVMEWMEGVSKGSPCVSEKLSDASSVVKAMLNWQRDNQERVKIPD